MLCFDRFATRDNEGNPMRHLRSLSVPKKAEEADKFINDYSVFILFTIFLLWRDYMAKGAA